MIPSHLAMLAMYRFSKLGLEFAHRVVIVGPGLWRCGCPTVRFAKDFRSRFPPPARLAVTVRMDVAMASRHLYP